MRSGVDHFAPFHFYYHFKLYIDFKGMICYIFSDR